MTIKPKFNINTTAYLREKAIVGELEPIKIKSILFEKTKYSITKGWLRQKIDRARLSGLKWWIWGYCKDTPIKEKDKKKFLGPKQYKDLCDNEEKLRYYYIVEVHPDFNWEEGGDIRIYVHVFRENYLVTKEEAEHLMCEYYKKQKQELDCKLKKVCEEKQ